MKLAFKFDLDTPVVIKISNEEGIVIGRAEYVHADPSYFVRYRAADGRAVEGWWDAAALAPAAV